MNLYQDNTKALRSTDNLLYMSDFEQAYKSVFYYNFYDFHFSQEGGRKILTLEYKKEVEQHLTEINYLGI